MLLLIISDNTVEAYGLFQKIIVDRGTEFFLTLFIQEHLRNIHYQIDRAPYVQLTSPKVKKILLNEFALLCKNFRTTGSNAFGVK